MSTSTSASSTSSSSHSYSLSSTAYTLPILHAARHPSSSVLGVFLGPISSTQTQVDPKSESQALIEVDEAIPLIHSYTNLSPITEIALSLVTEYANLRKKRIVGIYLAKEYGNDSLTRSAERILGALREQQRFDGVFALVLDNDKLSKGEFAYIPYIPSSTTTSKPILSSTKSIPDAFSLSNADLPCRVIQIIRAKKIHRNIRDFDDNLENPDADWLENTAVKANIKKYLS